MPPAALPPLPRPDRRRAGAALAAVGLLSLAGAAPAEPPALAAPDAGGDSFADPHAVPGLAAPSLAGPADRFEPTPAPLPTAPLRTEPWPSLAAPSAESLRAPAPERFAAPPAELAEDAADEDKPDHRGWLSFSPRRVRTASNYAGFTDFGDSFVGGPSGGASFYEGSLGGGYGDGGYPGGGYADGGYVESPTPTLAPEPDPISSPRTAYRSQDLENVGPAPAPLPIPMGPADDPALADGGFDPVPARLAPPRPAPPAVDDAPLRRPSYALPSDTVIRNGVPVRDLRSPEPPPYAPHVDGDSYPYGANRYGAGAPLPPTGLPFGDPYGDRYGESYGNPYAGLGGFGAGPIASLGSAGGMCELGLCDGAVPLFTRVEIEDPDHVHPLAVRQVVAVADPRIPAPPIGLAKLFHRECKGCLHGCRECDALCDDGCALVFVEICVPPCQPEEVKVTRHGYRVHLDFGKYEVTLTSRDGYVRVDYDD
ncbi:hypothetical protein [Alienimonas californiensis]|uniref:4Fe-4S ferredoxin-type domain-containing protein n=1 Tax=Alienimonas californiensis TaxID=2527989 RepID=A0A517P637_9PLAN|nr:hypothetical protein [Alienimonas californiensis]QDT14832.1 hypothetical protein CA12_09120 [Alienimonas californiensis]